MTARRHPFSPLATLATRLFGGEAGAGILLIVVAIAAMIAAGDSKIAEIWVIADSPEPVPCCGGCRQKIAEFAAPDVIVTLCTTDGKTKSLTVAELLPGVFTAAHMDKV